MVKEKQYSAIPVENRICQRRLVHIKTTQMVESQRNEFGFRPMA